MDYADLPCNLATLELLPPSKPNDPIIETTLRFLRPGGIVTKMKRQYRSSASQPGTRQLNARGKENQLLIEVRIGREWARGELLRWLATLASKSGIDINVRWSEPFDRFPTTLSVLFALERMLHGLSNDCVATHLPMNQQSKRPDLVLDLCGP